MAKREGDTLEQFVRHLRASWKGEEEERKKEVVARVSANFLQHAAAAALFLPAAIFFSLFSLPIFASFSSFLSCSAASLLKLPSLMHAYFLAMVQKEEKERRKGRRRI